ncbi:queuine tRNA-ribosyltransferase accessory subunit 2-like [Selaginella moellendorffii]|uniref:queuine tRNA-ribosyltransferase accessory subunit 2-like n=1 Tax=Selaginella moellendorffii TaxID=88036 RepID=UPI000D1CFCBF|nr:queuine tRNA-ribosyltransferase accessory subunit 2-like [Selaginella moellendorffii]|eukprot:XP_024523842.1 queuine tRNA-ribosyltransferase accessory subunit 2-like [Selaginella moellendorffii]
MRFALKAGGGDGARCGVMNFGAALAPVDTPCLLLSTRRGLPSFVSTDLLPELHPDARVLHVNPVHLGNLQAVSTGVDIFDSTYPHTLTKGGYAMTFPLSMDEKPWKFSLEDGAELGADFTKINLRSIAYRCDVTPLKPGCTCYTCQKHTRAYINHLLNTHEMVAQTLLDMHNIHHYLSFFQAIRDAICGSYFEEFQHWFIGQRRYCESECFDVNVSLLTPEAANIL